MNSWGLLNSWELLKFPMFGLYDIPILVYHSISNKEGAINLKIFKRHLEFFRQNRYEVISLMDLANAFNRIKRPSQRQVCLTFDDGYADFFLCVWPLLKEYDFPATVFVIVNRIGRQGYLKFSQIREILSSSLITVGSHTMEHRYLLNLDQRQLIFEIKESKRILEDNLGFKIDFFSYPWGGFSHSIQDIVRDAGYKMAFTTNQGISRSIRHKDPYALKRLTMSCKDSLLRFYFKISGFGYCFSRKIK